MFYGEYHHQLDDKCRFRIPPRFREQLGKNPMMIVGFDKCLMLYTQEDFTERVTKRLNSADILDTKLNKIKRVLLPQAQQISEDKQGRVLLSSNLMQKCNITKNLISIGVLDHVEIWDEESYKAHMESIDVDAILESFDE